MSTNLWCKTHTYGTNFDAPGGPFDKLSLFSDAQRWESKILPRLYFYIRAENHLMYIDIRGRKSDSSRIALSSRIKNTIFTFT